MEQRLREGEGASHMDLWGKNVQAEGTASAQAVGQQRGGGPCGPEQSGPGEEQEEVRPEE